MDCLSKVSNNQGCSPAGNCGVRDRRVDKFAKCQLYTLSGAEPFKSESMLAVVAKLAQPNNPGTVSVGRATILPLASSEAAFCAPSLLKRSIVRFDNAKNLGRRYSIGAHSA